MDVPNAALMIVENAERFGLSQLHQLRGRVGRGRHKSWCVLISDAENEEARARLNAMTHIYDGFSIAEEDLRLRGPGDFFGARQHACRSCTSPTSARTWTSSAAPSAPRRRSWPATRAWKCRSTPRRGEAAERLAGQ